MKISYRNILLGLLVLSSRLANASGALPAPAVPKVQVRLAFEPQKNQFVGRMSVPRGVLQKEEQLFLYPNRFLHTEEGTNREERERYSTNELLAQGADLRRKGSMVVTSARWRNCDEAEKDQEGSWPKLAPSPEETRLILKDSKSCDFELDFVTHPPHSFGNFGIQSSSRMSFSGPLFPILGSRMWPTQVEFDGMQVSCQGCVATPEGTKFEYLTLPPAVTIASSAEMLPEQEKVDLGSFSLELVGFSGLGYKGWIVERVRRTAARLGVETKSSASTNQDSSHGHRAALYDHGQDSNGNSEKTEASAKGTKPTLRINAKVLARDLVLAAPGEIQLGVGFLKVSIFLTKYHEMAFQRVLNRQLLEMLIKQFSENPKPGETLSAERKRLAFASLVGEVMVWEESRGLSDLKSFAEMLSFVPFFNDILEGKALTNNNIFLGREDVGSSVDSNPKRDLTGFLNGKEILDRLEQCFPKVSVRALVLEWLSGWIKNPMDLDLASRFPSENICHYSIEQVLSEVLVRERLSVEETRDLQGNRSLLYQRAPRIEMGLSLFQEGEFSDRLVFRMEHERDVISLKSPSELRRTSTSEGNEELRGSIEGVNTNPTGSGIESPKPWKFLLSGIRLRFSSRVGSLEGQQGVEWRKVGDPSARSLSLSIKREAKVFSYEPGFGWNLGTVELIEPIASFSRSLLQPTISFPAFVSLSNRFTASELGYLNGSLGASGLSGNVLVPAGIAMGVSGKWKVNSDSVSRQDWSVAWNGTMALPLARLATGLVRAEVGKSTQAVSLQDFTGERARGSFEANRYVKMRTELRVVALHDLKIDFAGSFLFEDFVVYAAHLSASKLEKISLENPKALTKQGLAMGFQFFGSFFNAKNQSVSAEVTRNLDKEPTNTFSVTVGRQL